jgi:hypothetical protein
MSLLSAPIYVSSGYADAATRGNISPDGSWYISLPGTLSLPPGTEISVQKAYLHVPGSSSNSAGAIKVLQPITTVVRCFPYYVVAETGTEELGIVRNIGQSYFSQLQGIFAVQGGFPPSGPGLMYFDVTISVGVGTYEPAQLAQLISQQTRVLRTDLPALQHSNEVLPRSQTFLLMDSTAFDDGQQLAPFALTDLDHAAGQGVPSGSAPRASFSGTVSGVPAGSTNGLTVFWDASQLRFQISNLNTPLYAPVNGSLCAARSTFTLNGNVRQAATVGSSAGIAVPTPAGAASWFLPEIPPGGCSYWCINSTDFSSSIWALLGFTLADLHRDNYAGWTCTDTVLTPSMLAGGAALTTVYASTQIYTLDASSQTNAITASGSSQTNSPGFYELLIDLVPTQYMDAAGKQPSIVGVVDAAFPSGDLLTADTLPPHIVQSQTTVSGIRYRFRDGVTKQTVIPGNKSAVVLQILPAQVNQPG